MSSSNINSSREEGFNQEKIDSLQNVIAEAEKTIADAKKMLVKLQGNEQKIDQERPVRPDEAGQVVYGTFDGQVMLGEDEKQYPVPSNYASKSKLVENDLLKLTITPNGNFVYKQVGPVERKYLIGIVEKDEKGNYVVNVEGMRYKVLLAAATYFKVEVGDEVTLVVPRDNESVWGAIENVLRKASDIEEDKSENKKPAISQERLEEAKRTEEGLQEDNNEEESDEQEQSEDEVYGYDARPSAIERLEKEIEEERKKLNSSSKQEGGSLTNEEIEQMKKEASQPVSSSSE